ncbi:MAG: hypothetical protein KF724_09710 [Phycisphaeraceae bacterium]|nr:hypothetical protein [Phycisphaeraceae bacterium]
MRDEPDVTPAPASTEGTATWRLSKRWSAVVLGAVLVVTAGAVWWIRSAPPPPVERTPLERLAEAELALLGIDGAGVELPSLPPGADRDLRRRHMMLTVRRLLALEEAERALEVMASEELSGSVTADGAWRSLRLHALRVAGRAEVASAECLAWRRSMDDEHPERAWADAELALDFALAGDFASGRRVAEPWLDRALSPVPASRLRLAEALLRSSRGDHAVAAAALESALQLDRSLDPRSALGQPRMLAVAIELADEAVSSDARSAAIRLHEIALELGGKGSVRLALLERLAALSRADAIDLLERSDPIDPTAAERINRRLLAAAAAAREVAERMATDSSASTLERRTAALHLAAECWERVGLGDDAVVTWREWLLARPTSDPMRAEVLARVAETLHGLGRFGEAVDAWRHLLKAYPNSPHAARATIAAARSMRADGRTDDAVALLDEVIQGRGGIDPESPVFVEALIERGRLASSLGDSVTARRRLDEARRRDPGHPASLEVTLLLADAWRGEALSFEEISRGPAAPSDAAHALRQAQLAWRESSDLFALAVARIDLEELTTQDEWSRDRGAFARLGLAASLEALGDVQRAILAYEETDRRHAGSEAALVALARLMVVGEGEIEALRRRALRRIEVLDSEPRLMTRAEWRRWFAVSEGSDDHAAIDNPANERSTLLAGGAR